MGAVTLRRHDLVPAVVGQAELDPNVQEMRQQLRERLGVESIDIGTSMATAFKVRCAVEGGRAVALLVDRAYPEDRVIVPFFGRPTPFLRSPALLARFCGCEILPGFFLRHPDGSYFNVWGEPLARRSGVFAGRRRRPHHDPRRRRPRGRHARATRRSGSTSTGSGTGCGRSGRMRLQRRSRPRRLRPTTLGSAARGPCDKPRPYGVRPADGRSHFPYT